MSRAEVAYVGGVQVYHYDYSARAGVHVAP
jgi:hypothetical protein